MLISEKACNGGGSGRGRDEESGHRTTGSIDRQMNRKGKKEKYIRLPAIPRDVASSRRAFPTYDYSPSVCPSTTALNVFVENEVSV
jgi:hypothetical protein